MNSEEMTKALLLLIGVFVSLFVGFELGGPIFSQLNSAYTSPYVNGTGATFNNNQPFISLIGLGYILAIVFIPLVLLGLFAWKNPIATAFDTSEIISIIILMLVLIFVAVIVYLLLLPVANSFYTTVKGYTWADNYATLITFAPLLFVLGTAVIVIGLAVRVIKEMV